MRPIRTFVVMFLCMLALTGCTSYLPNVQLPLDPNPRIFNLMLTPNQISGDSEVPVTAIFEFFDPDGGIDIDALVDVDAQSNHPIEVSIDGRIDQLSRDQNGKNGKIYKTITIDTSGIYNSGVITLRISLIDKQGLRSNVLAGEIELVEATRSRRLSACEIWFVEQPNGTPTDSFRIGQEVFMMVEDLTLGLLEPDVLYAELSSPSSGWVTVVPFFRTADPYIYASRIGPRLGVNVPARSGQTLLAFYKSYADRQEICLAQAKVF